MTNLCKNNLFIICCIIIALLIIIWLLSPIKKDIDLSNRHYYIAHAAGVIDGYTYTNSKEALLLSISNKYEFIELDLQEAKDCTVYCIHDWKEFCNMTRISLSQIQSANIKNLKIFNKYTPMTLNEALEIRRVHPYTLVTDKIDDVKILNRYFSKSKNNLRVETFSHQRYKSLKEHGYTPMMAMYEKTIFHYIYYCLKCRTRIEWITSSAHSYLDILKLRVLKKLFGVKIAFVPLYKPAEYYKDYIGREFDQIYVNDKSVIHN